MECVGKSREEESGKARYDEVAVLQTGNDSWNNARKSGKENGIGRHSERKMRILHWTI